MELGDFVALFVFVSMTFLAATTGAYFTPGAWYEALDKPRWTPPNWAFPVVWSTLYLMIAFSGWFAWRAAPSADALMVPMAVYLVQLLLNAAWSVIFFGMKRPDLALIEAVAFWISIAATIAVFAPLSPIAALLLVPYLVWVTVAVALNAAIVRLNPGLRASS